MGFFESIKSLASESLTESGFYDPGRAKEYGYDEVGQIPNEMGTYRIMTRSREILYIGISNHLRRRVQQHKSAGEKFKRGEIVSIKIAKEGVSYDDIREHERQKVKIHNPPRNQRSGGGGRSPELDVD